MMKYTPHASFLMKMPRSAQGRQPTGKAHRRTWSAPDNLWIPPAEEFEIGVHWQSLQFSQARHSDSYGGRRKWGKWLGITGLRKDPRTGATAPDERIASGKTQTGLPPAPQEMSEQEELSQEEMQHTVATPKDERLPKSEQEGSRVGLRTGRTQLAPPSLTAIYVQKYHPVTAMTFIRGREVPKSAAPPTYKLTRSKKT